VDVQQVIKELTFKTIHKLLLTMLFFWDMILGKWFQHSKEQFAYLFKGCFSEPLKMNVKCSFTTSKMP